MTKKQKDFIANAKIVEEKEKFSYKYKNLFIIDSGKLYKGFFATHKTYNHFIVIGLNENDEYILISDWSDIFEITPSKDSMLYNLGLVRSDIPRSIGFIRLFVPREYYFSLEFCISDCTFKVIKNDK